MSLPIESLPTHAVVDSPIASARIAVTVNQAGVVRLQWVHAGVPLQPARERMAREVGYWLSAFFAGEEGARPPLQEFGTAFQRRVWARLRRIPRGTTCTYGALALELGSGARAVAAACRANPLPLLTPCHRVVAASGAGGYLGQTRGFGPSIKTRLIAHEAVHRSRLG